MQQSFKRISGCVDRRKRAGRRNTSDKLNHHRLASVDWKKPLHITQKLNRNLPTLRTKCLLKNLKRAVKRARTHVLHVSPLRNHLHLLVEAKDNGVLGRGLRAVFISVAKAVNKRARRSGAVFKDRYHLNVITCPTQMKRTLEYVLLNQAKHQGAKLFVDEFSSASTFKHWANLLGSKMTIAFRLRLSIDTVLSSPTSWLQARGVDARALIEA